MVVEAYSRPGGPVAVDRRRKILAQEHGAGSNQAIRRSRIHQARLGGRNQESPLREPDPAGPYEELDPEPTPMKEEDP